MEISKSASRLKNIVGGVLSASAFLCGAGAYAVDARIYQLGDGGAIAPHLAIEIGSDSNVLRQNDGSDSSMFVRLEPSLEYIVQRRNNRLTLSYEGDYYQYFEDFCREPRDADCVNGDPQFDKASFQDHEIAAQGFLEITRQLRANVELERLNFHQPLGTGLSINAGRLASLTEPDSIVRTNARVEVAYGAPLARGEVRFALSNSNREFDNEAGLSESDFSPSGTILYRIGTKTQLFAGLSSSSVTGGNSPREISRQFVGISIDASAITSGTFQLNNIREDYEGPRSDLDYIGWDVSFTWKPRRFSTVTVNGGRETSRGVFNLDNPDLATVVGDDIGITSEIGIDWRHFWRDRFSTDVDLRWLNNCLLYTSPSPRDRQKSRMPSSA